MELIRGTIPDWVFDGYGSSGYGYGYRKLAERHLTTFPDCSILAFWKSDKNGKPSNGGEGASVSVGTRERISGPLKICQRGFHATMRPEKWKGERLWIVALHGDFQQDDDKFCALEREIIAEIQCF